MNLSVRPLAASDVPLIVEYFCHNPPEFYERLGVDMKKVPPPDVYAEKLRSMIGVDPRSAEAFYSVWLIDGEPCGHSALKDIVYGDFGSQHLHMWKPAERGKGAGATLFCLSTLEFYRRFELKRVICEPKASNPLPNRMLQKIGFRLSGSRVASSSDIAVVCELNTYEIDRDVAEAFLKKGI